MTQPAFSICIPNYNYGRYIGQTIQSVLNQTYPHFEIIVVDNASTDNSVEVIESFHSDRIRLYRNAYNVGYAPNLDRAATKASNPYIIMLSSDDLMRPTALEEYVHVIETMGDQAANCLVLSTADVIDGDGKRNGQIDRRWHFDTAPLAEIATRFQDPDIEAFDGLAVFRALIPRMAVPGPFCSTLYSRDLYERVGGYSSVHVTGPDAHLAYKILLQDPVVVFINRALFAYRVHSSNQTGQSRQGRTLKFPINYYSFSIEYSDADLARAKVNREWMARYLVDTICLKDGLNELRSGLRSQAFRYLMFAFASYPSLAVRNWKSYALAVLLLTGPLGTVLARPFYQLYKHANPSRPTGESRVEAR